MGAQANKVMLPMHDAFLFVKVLECLSNLCDYVLRQVLAQVREPQHLVVKLSSGCEFKNYVVVLP